MKNCEKCAVWDILKHIQPDYKVEGKPMKRICTVFEKGIPKIFGITKKNVQKK